LPLLEQVAAVKLARIRRVAALPANPAVLDIGSGLGGYVIAFSRNGCECVGVEPNAEARAKAERLSEHVGVEATFLAGSAEDIPAGDGAFDLVHAQSVVEHVRNLGKALREIYRVLKPDGIFWFYTASGLCPWQGEIRGFPMFGWYPRRLKRRIMDWAAVSRPELVGYARTPAINWFTPGSTRRLLRSHGFRRIYDRWDVRLEAEGGPLYGAALRLIRSSRITKFVADIAVPDCAYTAVK
jgi:2-polyprenyl-6-hydroxyphenyl methylase/3-demethylubiquinone-9 3-methyltransferase